MKNFDIGNYRVMLSRMLENMNNILEHTDDFYNYNAPLFLHDKYKNWLKVDYVWVTNELLKPLFQAGEKLESVLPKLIDEIQTVHSLLLSELSKLPNKEPDIDIFSEDDKDNKTNRTLPETDEDDLPF